MWNEQAEAALRQIEADLTANREWHRRNSKAVRTLAVASRKILAKHGPDAANIGYQAGMEYLRAGDGDHGLPQVIPSVNYLTGKTRRDA